MKIKDVLNKIAKGEELTEAEKDFLKNYQEPKSEKAELDKAKADLKMQQEKASQLEEELAELKKSNMTDDEKKNADLSKAQSDLAKAIKERDDVKIELAKNQRLATISKLASKHNFTDENYLDYLLSQKDIKLDNDNATDNFIKELSNNNPALFKSNAKSGAGTKTSESSGTSNKSARFEELMKKEDLTSGESIEMIRLQQESEKADNK